MTKAKALTTRQRDVLEYILGEYERGGPLPTARAICEHFGWSSTNAAATHLFALERRKVLRRDSIKAGYGIVLTHPDVVAIVERLRGRAA